jgi:hypothetical protein
MSEEPYIEIPQISGNQPNYIGVGAGVGNIGINIGAPPTLIFGGIKLMYVLDPMQELELSKSVFIRQEPTSYFETCEAKNRFYVFTESVEGGPKLLFKCKERSGCCVRTWCPASSRSFNMLVKHIASLANLDEDFSKPFVEILRPYKCTCCCLARPEMLVKFGGGDNRLLGKIKEPFSCFDPVFDIYNENGVVKYRIHADCCQCALLCRFNACGKIHEGIFNIMESSNIVGSIIKKKATIFEIHNTADSYLINFPPNATPTEKMLLIAAGLMIDYQYFEEPPRNNDD